MAMIALACLLASCGKRAFPNEGLTLGGVHYSYATLRDGLSAYGMYCRSCHGAVGDGRGTAGIGLRPAPSDLRRGFMEFASVRSGQLPTDDDIRRVIRHGLRGTAMLPSDLADEDLETIIAYVKSLSPRFRREPAGRPISIPPDPWRGRAQQAIARGERVYHSVARCWACHPAYESPAQLANELAVEIPGLRASLDESVVQIAADGSRLLPPDFAQAALKAGDAPSDVYRTIAAGLGGTAMPAWDGVLASSDLWALTYYVRGLRAH
jgi:mono/diheme cytochrome c family protein